MNYHTIKELAEGLPKERSIAEVWVENGSRRGLIRRADNRRGWVVAVLDNGIRIKIKNF